MSNIKVSELTNNNTNTINDNSLFYISEFDGISTYTSENIKFSGLKQTLINNGFLVNLSSRSCASFYSTETQTTTGTTQAMTFTNQDVHIGSSLVEGSNSKISVSYPGKYNLQFSAQIIKTQGGTSKDIFIWFRVNDQDIPNSNTKITLANNGQYTVASWNIFLTMQSNDYVEIMWGTSDNDIQLRYDNDAATTFGPAIPSVIATIQQL